MVLSYEWIGKVSRRIASTPLSSRRLNGLSAWRNSAYESTWMSVSTGTSPTVGYLLKRLISMPPLTASPTQAPRYSSRDAAAGANERESPDRALERGRASRGCDRTGFVVAPTT